MCLNLRYLQLVFVIFSLVFDEKSNPSSYQKPVFDLLIKMYTLKTSSSNVEVIFGYPAMWKTQVKFESNLALSIFNLSSFPIVSELSKGLPEFLFVSNSR